MTGRVVMAGLAISLGALVVLSACAPPNTPQESDGTFIRYTVSSSTETAADSIQYTRADGSTTSNSFPSLPWSTDISIPSQSVIALRVVDAQAATSGGTASGTTTNRLVDAAATFLVDGVATGDLAVDTASGQTTRITAVTATQLFVQSDVFVAGEPYEVYAPQLYSISISRVDADSGGEALAVFSGQSYDTDLTLQTTP